MQVPEVWLAARSLLTVLSSANAMCAQPFWSMVSMMKSSRLRLELGARQKMPRLQMSPMCTGVVVICVTAHVARPGGELQVQRLRRVQVPAARRRVGGRVAVGRARPRATAGVGLAKRVRRQDLGRA